MVKTVAEPAGFEPARAFTPCLFSKEVRSTTLTRLRLNVVDRDYHIQLSTSSFAFVKVTRYIVFALGGMDMKYELLHISSDRS
jgi:hypothetical protein